MERYSTCAQQPESPPTHDRNTNGSPVDYSSQTFRQQQHSRHSSHKYGVPSVCSPTAVSELPALANSPTFLSSDCSRNSMSLNESDHANSSMCSHRATVSVPARNFYNHDDDDDSLGRIVLSAAFDDGSVCTDSRNPSPCSPPPDEPEFVVDVQENGGAEVILLAAVPSQELRTSVDDENVKSLLADNTSLSTMIPLKKGQGKPVKSSKLFSRTLCSMPSALQEGVDGVKDIMKGHDAPKQFESDTQYYDEPRGKHRQQFSLRSLEHSADDVAEHIPSHHESPEKSLLYGPSLSCGSNCYTSDRDSETAVTHQRAVEGTITNFLSSPGNWCDGWQAWSIHMESEFNCLFPNSAEAGGASNPYGAEPSEVRRILRNRAGNLNSRTRRIRRLRKDLSPFERPNGKSKRNIESNGMRERGAPAPASELKLTRSFTAEGLGAYGSHRRASVTTSTEVSESVVSCASSLLDSVQNCGESSDSLPRVEFHREEHDDDLCYDSDPGETGPHYGRLNRENNQAVESFLKHGHWTDSDTPSHRRNSDSMSEGMVDLHRGQKRLPRQGRHSRKKSLDLNDEITMKRIVEETIHRKMTLVWYRASNDKQERSDSPMAVRAWIELGSQLNTTLIQPKLMWRPAQTQKKNESSSNRGGLGITNLDLRSIDLLDISRVLVADCIDRQSHFLAKKHCSFVVETFERSFLFEASCKTERDDIVSGLKVIIARLGSKIIVGDDSVFDEFFTPFGLSVPGEAPAWAQNGPAEND